MSDTLPRLTTALADRYRIERELGAGGMATVYLAEDLKHDRKVAIKVLKPELAAVLGPERFVVEIKTTAALQHPHILPLFDSGTADGFLFYVMPFIKGETIREKLNRETQCGVDDAVRIAREVADALDYAHRSGVIHRDIKPENILLHDGRAMVMDFGIALAVSAAAGGRMTETGLSLGTPHYMSPEQATAEKDITGRSDIYSLASVLYEMLAGQPPHIGGAAQQVIMKIITEAAAPVTAMRKNVPPNVVAALAKALEKIPADRFESAKAFAEALTNPMFTVAHATGAPIAAPGGRWRYRAAVPLAIASVLLFGAASWGWMRPARGGEIQGDSDPQVVRFLLSDDPSLRVAAGYSRPFTVSPDGRSIVFRASSDSSRAKLWVRTLGEPHARPIAGTEGASNPIISPDGKWVAYYGDRTLHRVPIVGGEVSLITSVPGVAAAITWMSDDEIMYEQLIANGTLPIQRVKVNGGQASVAIPLDSAAGEVSQRRPMFLRQAGIAIYQSGVRGPGESKLVMYRMSDGRRERLDLPGNGGLALVDDRFIYARRDAVMAVRVDLDEMRIIGEPMQLEPRVYSGTAGTAVGLSEGGTLVYRTAGATAQSRLVLVDASGAVIRSLGGVFPIEGQPRFSPDGRKIAVAMGTGGGSELWVIDVATGEPTKLTSGGTAEAPSWFPDSRRIVYDAGGRDRSELRAIPVDGSAPSSRLGTVSGGQIRSAVAPDGRSVIVQTIGAGRLGTGMYREWIDGSARFDSLLVASGAGVRPYDPHVSPDGRWVAYQNRGSADVWVRALDGTNAMLVSLVGSEGNPVVWGPDSKRLYYKTGTVFVMIELQTIPMLGVLRRSMLRGLPPNDGYDLAPDGKTFVIVSSTRNSADIFVAVNWAGEARRAWRAAEKKK